MQKDIRPVRRSSWLCRNSERCTLSDLAIDFASLAHGILARGIDFIAATRCGGSFGSCHTACTCWHDVDDARARELEGFQSNSSCMW